MILKRINWFNVWKNILLHLLFWVIVVFYFAWGFGFKENPKGSIINGIFLLPGHLIMVYTILYFLVPRYLLQRKFLHFSIGMIFLITICFFVYTTITELSIGKLRDIRRSYFTVGRNIMPFLHIAGIALSIKLLKYWYVQRKQTIEAEKQMMIAELKLLKAQLHPHFLFNTLNNLYSHTLESSSKSPEIVMRLSGLLRFMIYESNVYRIPLSKELELLKNYISLEQLRYGDRLDMSITIHGETEEFQIAPLLLLPFLENAFKHGTSKQLDQCWINLNLSINHSTMQFKLINSLDPSTVGHSAKGGMGLQNVKRRLELLYKDKYTFENVAQEEVYVVTLNIELEPLEDQYRDKLE